MKRLFGRFAIMEGAHLETLATRYRLDVPLPDPAYRVEVAAIFAGVENRPADRANLFRIAIAMEQRAARFFTERAAGCAPGSGERLLYEELATEEREHASTLAAAYERWRRDKPEQPNVALLGPSAPHASGVRASSAHNAASIVFERADPARTALVAGGESLTYAALREAVARAAGELRRRGILPGDRVAIKLPDGFDWVIGHLGAMWAGAIAVPVNPRVPAAEWQYILEEAGFSLILAESADDTPAPWNARVALLDEFRRGSRAAAPMDPCPVAPDAPAHWCHSSGTSGRPKAVVHAHRFARRIEQVLEEGIDLTPDDRLYASSKLFFAYPQTNSLWTGLKVGATVIVDPRWPNAAGVAEIVAATRPTILLTVPSLYRNLVHDGLGRAIGAAGVRLCLSAGEALPPSVRAAWREQSGLEIVNGYGASETMVLAMLDRGAGFEPSPGVDIRPLATVEPGMPTRMAIRAPTVALGYLDRPQAQAEHFRGDTFVPADLFVEDAEGRWHFAGREDSLVKIRGRWVNLVDLEEKLSASLGGLREIAAVLVPDPDGVDAVACFYAADDADAVGASLRARADAMPPHQRPRWWHAIDTLPRGPTGKLLRRRLQDLHPTLDPNESP